MGTFNLDRFIKKNDQNIQDVLGGLEDVKVLNNYSEYMAELDRIEQENQRVKQFTDLNNRLGGVDLNAIPKYREEPSLEFNYDHPGLYDGTSQQLLDQYNTYVENVKKSSGKEEGYKTLSEYIDFYPDMKAELTNKGFYNQNTKQIPLSPDEYEQMVFQNAGFTPEEVALYKKGIEEKLGSQNNNEKLIRLVAEKYPNLVSYKGKQGDKLAQMLGKRAESLMVTPTQPENDWGIDVKDGNVVTFNKKTGRYKIDQVEGLKKPTDVNKNWELNIDENGNPYWGEWREIDGQPQFVKVADATNQDKLDYQNKQDKLNKTGPYSKTNSSRRYRGSSNKKGIDFSTYKPNQFKTLGPDDLANLNAGDLNELQKYSNMLTPETRDQLTNMLTGNSEDGRYEDENGTGSNNESYQDQFVDSRFVDYVDNAETVNEKQAAERVKDFISQVTGSGPGGWGRSDLTPEQWRDEIFQEQWNDLEWAILKQEFKAITGQDL